jgi:hypothetical protein
MTMRHLAQRPRIDAEDGSDDRHFSRDIMIHPDVSSAMRRRRSVRIPFPWLRFARPAGARTQPILRCASRGRERSRQREANVQHWPSDTLNSRELPQGQRVPAVHGRIAPQHCQCLGPKLLSPDDTNSFPVEDS